MIRHMAVGACGVKVAAQPGLHGNPCASECRMPKDNGMASVSCAKALMAILLSLGAAAASAETRVEKLAADIWRVRMCREGTVGEGHLNRYGVLEKLAPLSAMETLDALPVRAQASLGRSGWTLELPVERDARVYGLGDTGRKGLNRRGRTYDLRVENIKSYIPIPMIMTSDGWGLLVNTTFPSRFDVGETDPGRVKVSVKGGDVDFYVFTGADYRAQLSAYTRIAGRPALLPAFAFGFAYVANQWIDKYELTAEAHAFRAQRLPCDILGLEPGWMEYFYDFTTKKNWNPARFSFPAWTKSKDVSWIGALERMGFKLSLWMCMNYDVFVFEEKCAAGLARPSSAKTDWSATDTMPDVWQDEHIEGKFSEEDARVPPLRTVSDRAKGVMRQPVMRPDGKSGADESGEEPWFEHIKKFVDRGARCFKLDASQQCGEFPGRVWAGRYSSDEVHNMYPLVYGKQMSEGYEAYTGRRAMVYSACGYTGLQRYVASWAGDTGGGIGSLVSVLNLGLSGHSSQTCDVVIDNAESLHFGFFAPWCQQNNWDYFQQPWYREEADVEVLRQYMNLRYRLFPYLYTTAAESARTGWPMMRPLAFVYPDERVYDDEFGTYMVGDSLLVSSFVDCAVIPPGDWYEWRTGEKVTGPTRLRIARTKDWGGALYVKAGAVIPMWPLKQHIDRGWNEEVEFHVWPGADGRFELYEDDGDTIAYRKGAFTHTPVTWRGGKLEIGARRGAFPGMPDEKARRFTVVRH